MSNGQAGNSVVVSGRCYCGAITFEARAEPLTVCVCHCADCRRATGGPAVAVAAFHDADVTFSPDPASYTTPSGSVSRTFCGTCGSSLAFRGDYVPDQIYVHLGIIDGADRLAPNVESFTRERLAWLHVDGELDRFEATSRTRLNERATGG